MADIFLSYSSQDKSKVRLVAFALEKMGWSVWWDRKIVPGAMFDKVIEEELNQSRCVIVIWTQKSVASEWVMNEASAGAERKVLVPLLLEDVKIPLAFRRMEAARLIDWNGEEENTEVKILMNAVAQILGEEKRFPEVDDPEDIQEIILEQDEKKKDAASRYRAGYTAMITAGLVIALACVYYFVSLREAIPAPANQWLYYLVLVALGVAVSMLITGVARLVRHSQKQEAGGKWKYTGPVAGIILILSGGFYIPRYTYTADKIITVRVFDPKKNPVTGGQVKLYLPGYIRHQSIDNVGQAQFTGVSSRVFSKHIIVEVTSDGFENYAVDTIIKPDDPLLLTVSPVRVIHISGKIKTAGEMPLRDVEINVDGTKYYAISITDGSYTIVLKDYSPGDEITLTTSHQDYEDKTRSFRINGSEMKDVDFVLNPVK
ncbi:MAG: TIR domain-containing protein [Chitinophagaceae bacterium]|nr:TIR domain-containing protein [Chitinophagaceae bacterium]